MQFLSKHGRLFSAVSFVAYGGLIVVIFSASTFLSVLALIFVFLTTFASAGKYSSPVVWSLLGTLILIEALIFAQIYIESPDRYPNEVMAYAEEIVALSQAGRLEEAYEYSNAAQFGEFRKPVFEEEALKIPDKLELQALEYYGYRKDDKVVYVVLFLGPNEQVRLKILPQPEDPKRFWLERVNVNPLHRAQKPVTTYWMRGDRYLKK